MPVDLGQRCHPPYSPDLAPSDYYLFRNLKRHLRGRRFEDDKELTQAAGASWNQRSEDFCETGFTNWKDKWSKGTEVSGVYVEKK